jgi:hypothetical protein
MEDIPEKSERSSPNPRGFDSISFDGSRYEIIETLEINPPTMENVSKRESSSRTKTKPNETTFLPNNPHIESRSTLEFKHIRELEEMKNDPEV